jgi:histidine ammonia-lyase
MLTGAPSPAIVLDGATLTPQAVTLVARHGRRVELSVGALRDRTIGTEERERFHCNLLRSHAVSGGRPLAPELVRAGMVVRANRLGAGGAGVAPALLGGSVA